jgi:hypothetical protein
MAASCEAEVKIRIVAELGPCIAVSKQDKRTWKLSKSSSLTQIVKKSATVMQKVQVHE